MRKLTLDWKIQKSMKPAAKSFREAIDFPTESFETPKKSNVPFLKSHSVSRPSHSSNKSNRLSKHDTTPSKFKSVRSNFLSLRKPSRSKTKESIQPHKSNADSSKQVNSKKSTSKCFNSSFNDSFNELFFNEISKFSDEASSNNITTSPQSSNENKKTGNKNEICLSALSLSQQHENECFQEEKKLPTENVQTLLPASNSVPETCSVSNLKEIEGDAFNNDMLELSKWGLPECVVNAYRSQNITTMFKWQAKCLSLENVLKGGNLVYSAPTSAGKTLVAEILILKKIVETKKKGLMILPFVSVAREKVNYLQKLFGGAGVTVDGYMGTYSPPGGFNAVDVAICTIEKANNLINRLIEDGRIEQLGIIVVDELHMLGDPHRGYLLELLLTKLLYTCKKNSIAHIQVVGMSATLPNLNVLSLWLRADLYYTDFRPVPLHETFKVGSCIYDSKSFQLLRDLKALDVNFTNDFDHTIYLAMETVLAGHAVLIFCPTKNWCEKLAESIAREVFKLGKTSADSEEKSSYKLMGSRLREVLNGDQLKDILDQLSNSPTGLDSILGCTVPFGVAFHHAGLTFDERDIIESAFRYGIIKFLVATSTLSSGVNLPAKRVIIRSPLFRGTLIDVLTYKQMIGRAGRKGIDTSGESILLCKESEKNFAKTLVESELRPVKSCLMSGNDSLHSSIKRAVLEIIASGVAKSPDEISQYTSCTLLSASVASDQQNKFTSSNVKIEDTIEKCLQFLIDNEFIFLTVALEEGVAKKIFQPTRLGQAVLASGFSPDDSLRMLKELQLARRCFVLENDLHILYEVTPPYLSDQIGEINWLHYLSLWEQLPDGMRRVGELVGVEEQFIGYRMQGRATNKTGKDFLKLAVHQRFYAALALNDLIQEVPLSVVSQKYNCTRGILQSLQQTTSTFSGMLTVFCSKLGWNNMELLFGQFQKRVHFGIQQELCDLVRLTSINGQKARVLYNAGYETVVALANADLNQIAFLLGNTAPFESGKQQDGETVHEALKRKEAKNIWISGRQGLSNKEAADIIVKEARRMIEQELGMKNMQWTEKELQTAIKHISVDTKEKSSTGLTNSNIFSTNNGGKSALLYKEGDEASFGKSKELNEQISEGNNSINDTFNKEEKNVLRLNNLRHTNSSLTSNRKKRKYEMAADDHNDLIIQSNNGHQSLVTKKVKSDSVFALNNDQFSILMNSTFNCSTSLAPVPNSNKKSSAQTQTINGNRFDEEINVIEDNNYDENFALSQVAEMESIYLSHSFNHKLNVEYEIKNVPDAFSSPATKKNIPFIRHRVSGLSIFCSSTPVEKSINKPATQSSNYALTSSPDLFEFDKLNQNNISITKSNRDCKTIDHSVNFPPVGKFVDKLATQSNDFSFTKSQAVQVCENISFDDGNQTFVLELEKKSKTNEQSISGSFTPIKKSVKKITLQFDDGSFTESQAMYICEKISFDDESQAFIAETNHCENEQPVSYNIPPIEKQVNDKSKVPITEKSHKTNGQSSKNLRKNFSTLFNDCSLTKSQALHICERISFEDESQTSINDVEKSHKTNKQSIPCAFTPINKSIKNLAIQSNDCSLTKSQALHICEEIIFDESQISIAEKDENHKQNQQSIPCSSTPIEENDKNTVESNNSSLTKSQILYMCEKMSFNDGSQFLKRNIQPEAHPITLKLIKDITDESDFEFVASPPEDLYTDELSCKNDNKSVLEADSLVCDVPVQNNTIRDFGTALDFSDIGNLSKSLNTNGEFNHNALYGISDLSLNLDTEIEAKIFKASQNTCINPNNLPSDENIPCVENSVISSKDASSSLLSEVVNECVSPTPPKLSLFAKSIMTDQAKTPNKAKLLTPCTDYNVENGDPDSNSNSPIKNAADICVNLFSISQSSQMIEPESQNEIILSNSESILTNSSLAIQENRSSLEIEPDIKIIADDISFMEFINAWKKINKFSFSVACEKLTASHSIIGPQIKGNKNSGKSLNCQWLYGHTISIVGISLCWEKDCAFYIPFICQCSEGPTISSRLTCAKKMESIRNVFNKSPLRKTALIHDIKSQYKILCEGCGVLLQPSRNMIFQDPSVAAWMLNPDEGEQSLHQLVSNYLPAKLYLLEDYSKKCGKLGLQHESSISGEKRATIEAVIVFELMNEVRVLLRMQKLYRPFSEIEMPILFMLAKMEQIGFGFDTKLAESYRTDLQQKQLQLSQKAQALAGRKFNLASPKDIARVLYKELRLNIPNNALPSPVTSRYLSVGVSTYKKRQCLPPALKTNKEALERLKHLHPLPEVILNWRKISFCLSNVLMPLLKEKKFNKDLNVDRLHGSSYVYTVTGRVNMHSPNLQFIPRDFDVAELNSLAEMDNGNRNSKLKEAGYPDDEICGVSLRNMFIPCKDFILLSADYSQLELRMLAHLSRDRKLISLLNSGNDVFKMIASSWKRIFVNEVSDVLRQQAKQICYGMIYGIGPKTLSYQLGVNEEDAAIFMESFKDAYPNVKEYLKKIVENCKMFGYITTLGDRKRYLPAINSSKNGERARAERQAINTTIQGSAADIFKAAIIKIDVDMKKKFPNSYQPYSYNVNSGSVIKSFQCSSGGFLVLQLHDELIFEVREKDLESVSKIIRNNMENCTKLSVKLPVKIRVGSSWGSMDEMIDI